MFDEHTQWTERPCYYVIACHHFRRAWLAGPFQTRAEADTMLPHVVSWATSASRDPEAGSYNYQVTEHYNGEVRSILGELTEQFFAQVER